MSTLLQSSSPTIQPFKGNLFVADKLSWQVNSTTILDELSFSIQEKSFVGIIGPNGAGKSSLLRCMFGKNKLTNGSLHFKQQAIDTFSRKKLAQDIAVVLQEPPSHFEMTVFELVAMGLLPHKALLSFNTHQEDDFVKQAINDVGLNEKIQMPFNTLSGGEKQRVMLARAIVQKSKVLILDEPTNHLDIEHQIEVLHLVKAMDKTVLLSIHDLNMAAAFCDQLILMNRGKIFSMGSCEKVLTEENLMKVFNVKASIKPHPFHSGIQITYQFNHANLVSGQ